MMRNTPYKKWVHMLVRNKMKVEGWTFSAGVKLGMVVSHIAVLGSSLGSVSNPRLLLIHTLDPSNHARESD